MTHAFFKALLFLAAGVVIHAHASSQDIFHMGGLRKRLPLAFWSFIIGGSALAGLPLITAGFFSKDLILWQAWSGPNELCGSGLQRDVLGAMLTSFYTYRLILTGLLRHSKTRSLVPARASGTNYANHVMRTVGCRRIHRYTA